MKKYLFSLLLLMTALVTQAYNLKYSLPGSSHTESSKLLPLQAAETEEEPIVITPSQVGPSTYGRQVILRQVTGYR